MGDELSSLTVDAFQSRLGHRFRIRPSAESVFEAELVEARALGGGGSPPSGRPLRRTPFALVFRTTLTAPLPQRIYRVEHDEIGAHDIFLVPVAKDATGVLYEAVFT